MTTASKRNLGKYEIIEEIGRGGMATVYKALDTDLQRTVAIKVLPEYFRHDPSLIRRFKQEAIHAAKLEHPNIITIHDVGEDKGLLYFVMQYVEGQTLRQLIQERGPLDLAEATDIIKQMASALDYAHGQGYVHRDVKPTNILVSRTGQAILTDFGIVKAADGTSLTRTGALVGTPEYMSPEQAKGEEIDWRTDIYSLGVVVYEMLTGRAPFEASTPHAVLHAQIYEPPPLLSDLDPSLPSILDSVIEKALSKDPNARYQSAGELAQTLEGVQEPATIVAKQWPTVVEAPEKEPPTVVAEGPPREEDRSVPIAPPESSRHAPPVALAARGWRRRIPFLAAGGAMLAMVGVAVMAVVVLLVASMLASTGGTSKPTVEIMSPSNGSQVALGEEVELEFRAGDAVGVARVDLEVDGQIADSQTFVSVQEMPVVRGMLRWTPSKAGTYALFVRAYNREQVVSVPARVDVLVLDMGGEPTPIVTAVVTQHWPSPTPSLSPASLMPTPIGGGRIVFVSDRDGNDEIYVINADGSGQTRLTVNPANDWSPAWSPDGTRIAFSSYRDGNWEIYVISVDGSGQTRLTRDPANDWTPAWSPDGMRIAFSSYRDGNREIYVMNSDGTGQIRLTSNMALDFAPSWSPDGTRIAFESDRDGNREIYFMNADGSGLVRLTSNPGLDFDPVWSPDGTRIAFRSDRDGNWEIYVISVDDSQVTSPATRLTNNLAWDASPSWSPGGDRIALGSDRDGDWEIYVMNSDSSGLLNLTNNPADDAAPSWSRR